MSYVNDTLPLNVSLEEYLALPDKPDKENDRTNSFSILMDVWGEADRAVSMKGRSRESILKQLNVLHDVCNLLYSGDFDRELKEELMISEWELCDYLPGENIYGYSKEGVMDWFDQWCYKINYAMLG